MKTTKLVIGLLLLNLSLTIISCGPSKKTTNKVTVAWVNKEKIPPEPVKSVFIIAFTDNLEVRSFLENDLAAAAVKRGLIAYKSIEIIGPVDMKSIAPVKDVFIKKLKDLNCETVFTMALVHSTSETKYVPSSTMTYAPYSYANYGGYGGYGAYGPHGGFGGYYGYATSTMTTPGYYSTTSKYFLEAKLFDLNTDEVLMTIQTKTTNPTDLKKSSRLYTETVISYIDGLKLRK